jgi:hypothetical protein
MTVQSYKLKKGKQLSKTLYTLKGAKEKVKEYASKKIEITFVADKVVKVYDMDESGEIRFFSAE